MGEAVGSGTACRSRVSLDRGVKPIQEARPHRLPGLDTSWEILSRLGAVIVNGDRGRAAVTRLAEPDLREGLQGKRIYSEKRGERRLCP